MSNTFATSSIVGKTGLAVLKNMLSFSANVNRDWQDEFTENMSRGYAPGNTINIKYPPRYTYRAGAVAVPQATLQSTLPLTISQGGCDLSITALQRTTSLTKLEDILAAAMAPVATEIDRQGCQLAHYSTYNLLNAAGALPTTQALAVQAMADVNARLDNNATPVKDGNRNFIMNPKLNGAMIQGYAGLFNNADKVSGQYRTGYMQDSFGLHPGMDQCVDTHTNGTSTGGTAVTVGGTGSAIAVTGITGTITRGTVINLPGVFSVNPQTRTSTGELQDFVVTADVANGGTTINVSPAITATGAFQNVTNVTTAGNWTLRGAASTAYGTNIAFHKDAFTLAMVPLWTPPAGQGVKSSVHSDEGFTLTVTEGFDIVNYNNILRIDVLFGWAAPYPQLSAKYYTI